MNQFVSEPDQSLFRQEAVDHRNDRLSGAVVLSQAPSTKWLVMGICTVCAAAVMFISVARYARIETVPGLLVTTQASPLIMAPQAGMIERMGVVEGSKVRRGDELAAISTDRSSEAGQGATAISIHSLQARIALSKQLGSIAEQKRVSEQAQLEGALAASTGQIAALNSEIATQRDLVVSNKTMFDLLEPVLARGYVTRVEYERRRQAWLTAQQGLASLTQQQLALKGQERELGARLAQLAPEAAKDTNDAASATEALEQQRAELDGQRIYILRAPVAGRVAAIQNVVGSTVLPGAALMTIVPPNAQLRAELYAPSRAIGFARPGEEVRILFDAFPYQRFGTSRGIIASISRTVIEPRTSSAPIKVEEPVYKIDVALDKQYVAGYGQRLPLQPGMVLRANIVLERQTFLDWLLSPLRAVRNRS